MIPIFKMGKLSYIEINFPRVRPVVNDRENSKSGLSDSKSNHYHRALCFEQKSDREDLRNSSIFKPRRAILD